MSLPQMSWEHRWTHVAGRAGTGRQKECRGAVDLGSWLGMHLTSRLALLLPVLTSLAGRAAACLAPSWELPGTAPLPRLPARCFGQDEQLLTAHGMDQQQADVLLAPLCAVWG